MNAGTESVAIRRVASCNPKGVYSVTYTKEGNRNLANSYTEWNSQRHELSTGMSLVFPFFLRKHVREGHTTQRYRDEDDVNPEATQPIIL